MATKRGPVKLGDKLVTVRQANYLARRHAEQVLAEYVASRTVKARLSRVWRRVVGR